MVGLGEGTGITFGCINAICVGSQSQFTPSERLSQSGDCVESARTYNQLSPTMINSDLSLRMKQTLFLSI